MSIQRPSCNCFTTPCNCGDGSGYDSDGNYIPFGYDDSCLYSKNGNCATLGDNGFNLGNFILPHTTRPLVNTVYVPTSAPAPTDTKAAAPLMDVPAVSGFFQSAIDTVEAHPVIALGAVAAIFYFFFTDGGAATWEQVTTKRKGF